MQRPAPGEVVLALFFAVLGLLWVAAALRMPLWEGFVPQSGFMPLWFGAILAALAGAILLFNREKKAEEPVGKPLVVIALIAAAIVAIDLLGYVAAVFLLLFVLLRVVERLPLGRSALVAGATTAVLYFLFKTWLGVKLPAGLLGI
jgi:hypothetical protein